MKTFDIETQRDPDSVPTTSPSLRISWSDYSSVNLNERISKLNVDRRPVELDQYTQAVLFLRAVASRGSQMLPAFYLFAGSNYDFPEKTVGYPRRVLAHSVQFSSLLTLSLCCRKIFDDSTSGMTGKRFALNDDVILPKGRIVLVKNIRNQRKRCL